MATERREASRPKPTCEQLGIDLTELNWRRSGAGDGSFEVAFVGGAAGDGHQESALWVLLRVAGDPAGRVLVYDRVEWSCFLDGVRGGEFDIGGVGEQACPESRSGSNLCTKDVN